jgi:DNA-binding transcriptional LysR family regulator
VEGQLVVNAASLILTSALASFGLAYLPEDTVKPYLKERRLIRVLADCAPFSGYHLYYPSRRQQPPAFALLVEALRYPRTSARVGKRKTAFGNDFRASE